MNSTERVRTLNEAMKWFPAIRFEETVSKNGLAGLAFIMARASLTKPDLVNSIDGRRTAEDNIWCSQKGKTKLMHGHL
jgi:hypothetical protein